MDDELFDEDEDFDFEDELRREADLDDQITAFEGELEAGLI